jgi:hypothetical protein
MLLSQTFRFKTTCCTSYGILYKRSECEFPTRLGPKTEDHVLTKFESFVFGKKPLGLCKYLKIWTSIYKTDFTSKYNLILKTCDTEIPTRFRPKKGDQVLRKIFSVWSGVHFERAQEKFSRPAGPAGPQPAWPTAPPWGVRSRARMS